MWSSACKRFLMKSLVCLIMVPFPALSSAPSIAVPSVLLLLDSRSLKSDARVTHPQNTQIFNDK